MSSLRLFLLSSGFMAALLSGALASKAPAAYWIWSGLTEQDAPAAPDVPLYLYQGVIQHKNGHDIFTRKGIFPAPLHHRPIFLVFRMERGVAARHLVAIYASTASQWARHGVAVAGLQIDCDWPTGDLAHYARYLARVRALLPARQTLSVTGLADWAAHGDPAALRRMTESTGPIVFQLYRGRKAVPFTAGFIDRIGRLGLPFRLGLLASAPENLIARATGNPYYAGVVYFLQK